MKIILNLKTLALCFIAISFASCDEGGEPEPGGTSMEQYAGDWWITLTDSDGETVVEHALHSTYNAAANDNTMWVDDHLGGYALKSKVNVNMEDGTFSAVDAENISLEDQGTVTITEGRIIKGGGTSRGGHVVDSIYFRVHFSYDDPGYDIIHAGHKRTGFLEDEY